MNNPRWKHDDLESESRGLGRTAGEAGSTAILVVAFAGLPGTGKSTLARGLAERYGAPLLDKDRVREALFGPGHVTYTKFQNDFCCRVLYQAVDHLQASRTPLVVLDGRTYTRRADWLALEEAMERPGRRLALVECTAPDPVVRARLERDRTEGNHPAHDRGPALLDELRARAEPLEAERLTLDTGNAPPDALVERCARYLGLD